MTDKKESNIYLISIIAIVAIVGIVAMTMYIGRSPSDVMTSAYVLDDTNLAGEASLAASRVPLLPRPQPITFYEQIADISFYEGAEDIEGIDFDSRYYSGTEACEEEESYCLDVRANHYVNYDFLKTSTTDLSCDEISTFEENGDEFITEAYDSYVPYRLEHYLQEGETIIIWDKYNIKLDRVGFSSVMVTVSKDHISESKVISYHDDVYFDQMDDLIIIADAIFYVEGAEDNGANLMLFFDGKFKTEFEAICSKVPSPSTR